MKTFLKNEDGATAIEYGFIVLLIVIVCAVGIAVLGNDTGIMWNNVATKMR